ncbi:MAG: hypothetical protein K8S97_13075 [Anaerolineae bacterium]|nr:hypothetical protein [Anaerolineae bacterium]
MYKRFQALSIWGRILAVMITLFVISVIWPIIITLVKTLIMLAVAAVIIVTLLWLFDKVRGDNTDS